MQRWISVDPLAEKYPGLSPYVYVADNPINAIDPDGRDIVYINAGGTESHRVKNDKIHSTYIMATTNASQDPSKSTAGWKQVAMPNIIQERTQSGDITTGSEYQENDYLIAARTGYFNQAKNAGLLKLYTEGGIPIPQDAIKAMPDLDPTMVKAMIMQESTGGVNGVTDVIQANVGGDWDATMKKNYGLNEGVTPNVSNSIFSGIRTLATKGFKGGVTYNDSTGSQTFTFKGWLRAAGNYNGFGIEEKLGVPHKTPSLYEGYIKEMYSNSTIPKATNY